MNDQAQPEEQGQLVHPRRWTYRNYLLLVLLIVLVFNCVDREALQIVLQDIKIDLKLSDTQLGLLTGIAYALFYSVMGIPIARWADRGNRVAIISLTCILWSAMVVTGGFVANFTQLLLTRTGVAVGEAGCIPPAHSLIADYYTRAERPRAIATFMMGAPLSVLLGFCLAGWLNEFYGWRTTFILAGLPGLLLAPIAWFTLREPRWEKRARDASTRPLSFLEGAATTVPLKLSVWNVCLTLWANKAFVHVLVGYSAACLVGYGMFQWAPAFFIRSYGMKTGELGLWFALIWGLCGAAGTYWGGELASRYASGNERLQLRVMALVFGSFTVISPFVFLVHGPYPAFMAMALIAFGWRTSDGPLFATIQALVPSHMRATAVAIVILFANLIGLGLGPLSAGALSDALRPWAGEDSLRFSLLILSPGYLWAGWHLYRGSGTVTHDMATAERNV